MLLIYFKKGLIDASCCEMIHKSPNINSCLWFMADDCQSRSFDKCMSVMFVLSGYVFTNVRLLVGLLVGCSVASCMIINAFVL